MPLQGLALGQGHSLPKRPGGEVMSPTPRDSGSCPSSVTGLKGDLQPLFFKIWPRSAVWLCSPLLLGGLGRSSRPSPGAGASPSALAIFTRRDHERASDLPQGPLPLGGGTVARVRARGARRAAERLLPGCLGSGGSRQRGFWRGCLWRDREGELSLQKGAACLAPEASSWLSLCLAETGRAQSGSCWEFPRQG